MKHNNTIKQLKQIAIPSICYIIIGFLAIFLVQISIMLALIIEILNLIIYLFFIYIKLQNYKLKYFFLGKKYKKELEKYMYYFKGKNQVEKIFCKKWSKEIYRRNGTLLQPETKTPFGDMWSKYDIWCTYEGCSDEIYILCVIYDYLNSGGGLYKIFECLSHFFTYQQYLEIISASKLYSPNLKAMLVNKNNEKAYDIIRKEELEKQYKRNDEENQILTDFEKNESNKSNDFIEEINGIFETKAIELYLSDYKLQGLPDNYKELYYFSDMRKRIYIIFDDNLNVYKVFEDIFEFECETISGENDRKSELHSRGYWVLSNNNFGLYETIELARKDINEMIKGNNYKIYKRFDKC